MSDPDRQQLANFVSRQALPLDQVRSLQRRIFDDALRLSRVMDGPNFVRVGRDDLQRMVLMYDRHFFGGHLVALARREGLTFGWSSRMTKNAGKTVTHYPAGRGRGPRRFEIILSSSLLFQTFRDVDRPVEVTGIRCNNRLEAMQRVTEHELVHLLEMVTWDVSSCSRRRFQTIAHRFFGHTQHRHDLITQGERAARRFRVGVGSRVRFVFEQRQLTGVVNRITRRATVLVVDPTGEMFDDGRRYRRYYVPLEQLRAV